MSEQGTVQAPDLSVDERAEVARFGLDQPEQPMTLEERVMSAREHIHRAFEEVERPHLNPDCESGKHLACRGDAWCFVEDAAVDCGCRCHEGEETDRV
ncbi:MAG: hypothetical protein LCH43_11375 [Actinobacteria bacterium]|nr:hypothetical protein [Actinomycetota bacterium]